jgi:hypothetical protein
VSDEVEVATTTNARAMSAGSKILTKTDRDATYPTMGLIEMERCPRRIVFLEPYEVIFQEFQSVEQGLWRRRHCVL